MSKILLVLAALFALGACNTMEGVGKDVSATGDALTGEAQDAQEHM
jgi:predicted small secreted protein